MEYADSELYDEAVHAVMDAGVPSISLVQRRLRIGFSQAARLLDMMEVAGVVTSPGGTGARVIVRDRGGR